jgi:hypothetical protein
MKKVIGLFVVTLMLTACAGSIKKAPIKMVVDDKEVDLYVATTTSGGLDRSSTLTQVGYDTGRKDKDGKPILVQIDGGAELNTGSTVAGDVLRGVTVGTGAAYIQGEAIRSSARTKSSAYRCPDGTQVCHSTILQGAQALSNSHSGSSSEANLIGCPTGNCQSLPMIFE